MRRIISARSRIDISAPVPMLTGSASSYVSAAMAIARAASLTYKNSRSEEHTSELQSRGHLVCRLLLEKKKIRIILIRSAVDGGEMVGLLLGYRTEQIY